MYKKLISYIDGTSLSSADLLLTCKEIDNNDWDNIYIINEEKDEKRQESFLDAIRGVVKEIETPILLKINVNRFEDVKKALYSGAAYAVISYEEGKNDTAIEEGLKRFRDKVIIEVTREWIISHAEQVQKWFSLGLYSLLVEGGESAFINELDYPVIIKNKNADVIKEELKASKVIGLIPDFSYKEDIYAKKREFLKTGIEVKTFISPMEFSQLKKNENGLLPVVVQDYKTKDVLMVAYMNEEAFNHTIETGRMTYYSRSRDELWIKGETSGHTQLLMSLDIDCDNDTLLAKVKQTGAACHTGSKSCFYRNLVKREYDDTNPLTVFSEVMNVIKDRKENPKEGSYTNYLFDKGIDKILKKCGEEATEIIIAAKNPNAEELKYEISDFLYHMMVLMAECNVDWDDIVKELANR